MTEIIVTRVISKIGLDVMVEKEGHYSEVDVSMDRIIGEVHVMSMIIEMTLEETF